MTAVLSLGAGAVSFTHIVKAAEPVFTAGFSAALLGQTFAAPVYLSLAPIIAGVSLASLKELSFSWVAFGNAMGSNTASALRGILGKKQMGTPVGENMSAANLYAVLTVLAFCFLSPVALLVEGKKAKPAWDAAIAAGATAKSLSTTIMLSGLFYYLYNEVAFLALDSVNPVTVRERETGPPGRPWQAAAAAVAVAVLGNGRDKGFYVLCSKSIKSMLSRGFSVTAEYFFILNAGNCCYFFLGFLLVTPLTTVCSERTRPSVCAPLSLSPPVLVLPSRTRFLLLYIYSTPWVTRSSAWSSSWRRASHSVRRCRRSPSRVRPSRWAGPCCTRW